MDKWKQELILLKYLNAMISMKKLTFNEFCIKCCDGMYDPRLPQESQGTGYIQLRKMVIEQIEPASLEEIHRWENNPTTEELFAKSDIKYLRFLHPLLRPYIIKNWDIIKTLEVS